MTQHGGSATDADLAVKLFGTTMGAYLSHLWADPDHPAFLPSVGYYQMYGSPNPDTIYRTAVIDGSGEYLVGHRGSVPDVSIMPFGRPTCSGPANLRAVRSGRPRHRPGWDLRRCR